VDVDISFQFVDLVGLVGVWLGVGSVLVGSEWLPPMIDGVTKLLSLCRVLQ
jgi:hypothetical protein